MAMADENQQAPLVPPPVTSPVAIREIKSLLLLAAVILFLVVFSLAFGWGVEWVIDIVIMGFFLSSIFQRR